MLQLEVLYRLLDVLRDEAIQAVEHPHYDKRSAFGFGECAGMLKAIRAMRERIDETVAEANKQDEEKQQDS